MTKLYLAARPGGIHSTKAFQTPIVTDEEAIKLYEPVGPWLHGVSAEGWWQKGRGRPRRLGLCLQLCNFSELSAQPVRMFP